MGKIRHTLLVLSVVTLITAAGCGTSTDGSDNWKAKSAPSASDPTPGIARGELLFYTDFRQGCEAARQQNKPILLFFTAQWCHYCHEMARESFTNNQVINLSDHFVCILVDADASPMLCRTYGVRGFPTIQFLSSYGAPLQQVVGKQPTNVLLNQMHSALQAATTAAMQNARRPISVGMITRG
jgi:thiol:disulfide interchange protein